MEQPKEGFSSVDEYIATFPEEKRALLEAERSAIKAAAAEAKARKKKE